MPHANGITPSQRESTMITIIMLRSVRDPYTHELPLSTGTRIETKTTNCLVHLLARSLCLFPSRRACTSSTIYIHLSRRTSTSITSNLSLAPPLPTSGPTPSPANQAWHHHCHPPASNITTPRTSASPLPPPPPPHHPLLILSPPACLDHDIPGHFERPARVTSILNALQQHAPPPSLPPSSGAPPLLPPSAFLLSNDDSPLATREQLTRFHTQKHIETLFSLFARSKAAAKAGGGEDDEEGGKEEGRVRRASERVRLNNNNKNAILDIDADTSVCPGTEEAALRAAGAACRGVDEALGGRAEAVFCVIRPPGHHATPDRAMGFCFFNNVGVAAMHARAKHGVERVAILDPGMEGRREEGREGRG